MNSLLNLKMFKAKNGLNQAILADYLSVSRGFISRIDAGYSKMPREKIDKLYNNDMGWDTTGLCPAYTRLSQILSLTKSEAPLCAQTFNIGEPTFNSIKYGEIPINEAAADRILISFPTINKAWLMGDEEKFPIVMKGDPSISIVTTASGNSNATANINSEVVPDRMDYASLLEAQRETIKALTARAETAERLVEKLWAMIENLQTK